MVGCSLAEISSLSVISVSIMSLVLSHRHIKQILKSLLVQGYWAQSSQLAFQWANLVFSPNLDHRLTLSWSTGTRTVSSDIIAFASTGPSEMSSTVKLWSNSSYS